MPVRYVTVRTKLLDHPTGPQIRPVMPSDLVGAGGTFERLDITGQPVIEWVEPPVEAGDEAMLKITYEDRDGNTERITRDATAVYRENQAAEIAAERDRIKRDRPARGEVRGR